MLIKEYLLVLSHWIKSFCDHFFFQKTIKEKIVCAMWRKCDDDKKKEITYMSWSKLKISLWTFIFWKSNLITIRRWRFRRKRAFFLICSVIISRFGGWYKLLIAFRNLALELSDSVFFGIAKKKFRFKTIWKCCV